MIRTHDHSQCLSPDCTLLTEEDLQSFHQGTHAQLYTRLGAHLVYDQHGNAGVYFAVWAPRATQVSVLGDFNDWNSQAHPLRRRTPAGIWEGFVPGAAAGTRYKYYVTTSPNGPVLYKADPFGFRHETPPGNASVVWDLYYTWNDQVWMQSRAERQQPQRPLSIYEVHLGSWMRVPEENNRWLSYIEIAPKLAHYARQLGFTHVELLPIMEHPFYGSWGYQTTGYFAPTSRYGTPQELMQFIDYLHQHGLGVILDWVPSHFPDDEHGLAHFDGSPLFEHEDPRRSYHPEWHSYIFDYGRPEIRSFLTSGAFFWLDHYHADGLRLDAVASMLYLDHGRKPGQWIPNSLGGNENLEAIEFLQLFNEAVSKHFPDVATVAEESTAWPKVSHPVAVGGLGFSYKWDMGWMHDTLAYFAEPPPQRKDHYQRLTFRRMYAFEEKFILPLSHDEVARGKGSLLEQMPGDEWQQFAQLRLLLAYQWAQPGKKLLFMGDEFGQRNKWNHDSSLDWHLVENGNIHNGVQRLVGTLNWLYATEPSLHQGDTTPAGFEWSNCQDAERSTLSFLRRGAQEGDVMLIVLNFSTAVYHNFRVGVPQAGFWRERLNTDAPDYGGSGRGNYGGVQAAPFPWQGHPAFLHLTLPPLTALFLSPEPHPGSLPQAT